MTAPLFGRKLSLTVGSDAGISYDLSNLHVVFGVFSATVPTLKYSTITVYNLSRDKANALLKEFTFVKLSAGYDNGPFGIIFQGEIARVERGRDNATDTFVRIFAQDGDRAKNWAVTSKTLAAGWTDEDLYAQLMSDFQELGLEPGYNPGLVVDTQASRARTLYGKTDSYMNELANRQNCDWFIEDNKVNLVPVGQTLPGETQELSATSGIIGIPKQTVGGIEVRCLLNPNIRTACTVKLNNADISQLSQQQPFLNDVETFPQPLQGPADGVGSYKAHCVMHAGDTRANDPWYTDFIGVATDSAVPGTGPAFYDVPSE